MRLEIGGAGVLSGQDKAEDTWFGPRSRGVMIEPTEIVEEGELANVCHRLDDSGEALCFAKPIGRWPHIGLEANGRCTGCGRLYCPVCLRILDELEPQ